MLKVRGQKRDFRVGFTMTKLFAISAIQALHIHPTVTSQTLHSHPTVTPQSPHGETQTGIKFLFFIKKEILDL